MSEENKAIARRFYEDVVGKGNFDLLDEIVAEDIVDHEPFPGQSAGRAGVREFFTMIRSAFPDLSMPIEDIVAEGDKVVVRSSIRGTHKGEFMGIPATGKKVNVNVIDIVRIANGQAAEHWGVTDLAAMMEQLGVASAP